MVTGTLLAQFNGSPSFDVRWLIGGFILLSVAGAAASSWRLRARLRRRTLDALADVVVLFSFLAFVALAVVTWLFLWDKVNTTVVFASRLFASLDREVAASTIWTVGQTLLVVALSYIVAGFVSDTLDRFVQDRKTISEHQAQVFYRLTQLSVYGVAVIVILGLWNVNLTGLLVGAGFLGIVVGMAARQTLGALLAGLVLMFSRPFEIGDWIEIDEQEGIVTDISMVNTRIQTFDGEYVMIPNDVVGGSTITNRSRKGRLRLEVDVGVDYNADVERAAELAADTMKEIDDVLSVPTPQVVSKEFGDSAVVLGLRFWIDKPSARRKWRARTAVINRVKETYEDAGIKIPFPQRELGGREEHGGFRLAGGRSQHVEATTDGGPEEESDGDANERGSDGSEKE
ncbi:mechanosensitive ion channel family protein [halophilic archaeon]|nr:mechanosensitive ion channel family protein [halophilic archaeon]